MKKTIILTAFLMIATSATIVKAQDQSGEKGTTTGLTGNSSTADAPAEKDLKADFNGTSNGALAPEKGAASIEAKAKSTTGHKKHARKAKSRGRLGATDTQQTGEKGSGENGATDSGSVTTHK